MARPLRIEYPGAFYHVTSRGNEQKDVFKSQRDRGKFLEYLESATERYGAVVHVYCLMNNEQSLSSAPGDTGRESVTDHAAHKRSIHDIFQHQAETVRSSFSGAIQGDTG